MQKEQQQENSPLDHSEQLSNYNTDFDLGLFIYILKKSIFWILMVFVFAGIGLYLYLRYSEPVYQADSVIQIEKKNQASQLFDLSESYQINDISPELEILKSNYILLQA